MANDFSLVVYALTMHLRSFEFSRQKIVREKKAPAAFTCSSGVIISWKATCRPRGSLPSRGKKYNILSGLSNSPWIMFLGGTSVFAATANVQKRSGTKKSMTQHDSVFHWLQDYESLWPNFQKYDEVQRTWINFKWNLHKIKYNTL